MKQLGKTSEVFGGAASVHFATCLQQRIQFKGGTGTFQALVEEGDYVVRSYGTELARVVLADGLLVSNPRPSDHRFKAMFWDLTMKHLKAGTATTKVFPKEIRAYLDLRNKKEEAKNKVYRQTASTKRKPKPFYGEHPNGGTNFTRQRISSRIGAN